MMGARSLTDVLIDSLVANHELIDVDEVASLPPHLLKRFVQGLKDQNQQLEVKVVKRNRYIGNLRNLMPLADFKSMEDGMYEMFYDTPRLFEKKESTTAELDAVTQRRYVVQQTWEIVQGLTAEWWAILESARATKKTEVSYGEHIFDAISESLLERRLRKYFLPEAHHHATFTHPRFGRAFALRHGDGSQIVFWFEARNDAWEWPFYNFDGSRSAGKAVRALLQCLTGVENLDRMIRFPVPQQ